MEEYQIRQILERINNNESDYIKVKNRANIEKKSMYKIIELYGDPKYWN